jgi:hypothetical protein
MLESLAQEQVKTSVIARRLKASLGATRIKHSYSVCHLEGVERSARHFRPTFRPVRYSLGRPSDVPPLTTWVIMLKRLGQQERR